MAGKDAPLSVIALQIVKEALRPEATPAALAQMAERDPAFALRVIAMVNSAAFGAARRVSDVKQAAALLGVRGLRSVGMSLALSDMIPVSGEAEVLLANSLRRAVAAQLLADRFGERDRNEYFTAGLFLELGILARAREDLKGAAQVARAPAADRPLFERAYGVREHPIRGAELAVDFHLSEATIAAIRGHHDAAPPETVVGKVTWLAERIAGVWEGGDVAQTRGLALEGCRSVGLSEADLDDVLRSLPEHVTQASSAFDRKIDSQKSYEALLVDVNRGLLELTNSYEAVVRQLEVLLEEKEDLTRRLAEANDRLERLAHTDALTGLANKRALEQALARDLARADRDRTSVCVIVADVDHFKKVNDRYGHPTGDVVLKGVAKALSANLRSGDLATRFGGEEFVLILPGSNTFGGQLAAERIRKSIEARRFDTADGPLQVTMSFGVASVCGPGCGGGAADLIAAADSALYQAKQQGRNRVMSYTPAGTSANEGSPKPAASVPK
ncbi:MAG TPA: diguanylate cyclase [Polyangiaceae bacterium]|nr:diguanylate cyclase [Polyangiaceae bacterium]